MRYLCVTKLYYKLVHFISGCFGWNRSCGNCRNYYWWMKLVIDLYFYIYCAIVVIDLKKCLFTINSDNQIIKHDYSFHHCLSCSWSEILFHHCLSCFSLVKQKPFHHTVCLVSHWLYIPSFLLICLYIILVQIFVIISFTYLWNNGLYNLSIVSVFLVASLPFDSSLCYVLVLLWSTWHIPEQCRDVVCCMFIRNICCGLFISFGDFFTFYLAFNGWSLCLWWSSLLLLMLVM